MEGARIVGLYLPMIGILVFLRWGKYDGIDIFGCVKLAPEDSRKFGKLANEEYFSMN
jgi:hypothetical protein